LFVFLGFWVVFDKLVLFFIGLGDILTLARFLSWIRLMSVVENGLDLVSLGLFITGRELRDGLWAWILLMNIGL
jgi:hypothetical protein